MAKFNIEIELDWLDEDESIDEEIKRQVIAGLQNSISRNVEKEINSKMAEQIEEEVKKVSQSFIERLSYERLSAIQIPTKKSYYSSDIEYVSLSEFIGEKFEDMMSDKTLTKHGEKPDYHNDAVYSVIEYLTKGHIANELNDKIVSMIQQAKTQAEETLISNLEQNLQQQLNADMIQKLNIPELLNNLSNTISIEGEHNER